MDLSPIHLQWVFFGLLWLLAALSGLALRTPTNTTDIQAPRAEPLAPAQPPEVLVIRQAVAGGAPVTERIIITSPRISIGRASDCDIRLDDEFASSRHAAIQHSNGALSVEDLGSKNGTFVNDLPIRSRTDLKSGDEIHIGQTIVRVE